MLEILKLSETDAEQAHLKADEALLRFIDDPEVTSVWKRIKKWYAMTEETAHAALSTASISWARSGEPMKRQRHEADVP